MNYTITLTDSQDRALRYEARDPQEWIEHMVTTKCKKAIERIVKSEVNRITDEGGTLSGTKDDIVMNAPLVLAAERGEDPAFDLL